MTTQLIIGQFQNWLSSVSTYADMSPDLKMRSQVNQRLKGLPRRALSALAWSQQFSHQERAYPVLSFLYQYLSQYSGLDFSRIRPDDRLIDDLHFPLVCWFDWSTTLCEDFFHHFGLDLSDDFDEGAFETIDELVQFLMGQVLTASASESALWSQTVVG